jgi:DNA invertase Pin-like site-specific DNA recombinase
VHGRLVFHLLAAIDEFQRELIVEGTNEGLASARARGRTGGRRPKFTPVQEEAICATYDARVKTVQEIADGWGTSRRTVYDILARRSTPAAVAS